MSKILLAAAVAATFSVPVFAHDGGGSRIDDHAPIGVMADHYHKKGEWMTSLRWMTMDMNDPTNSMMGPQSMSMNMVMAGMMYAVSDKVTLTGMVGFSDKSMDMLMMGNQVPSGANGISDAKIGAIVPLYTGHDSRLLFATGLSIPVGKDGEENSMGTRLALNMQPGTGAWGVTPSVTYTRFLEGWSLGAQANARLWLDKNRYGEKAADSFAVTSWVSRTLTDDLSVSLRCAYETKGSIKQADVPALGDDRQSFTTYVGANVRVFGGHRLAIEAGMPVWQDRGDNALAQDFTFTVGWQKAF